jgi:hypothetical protein
MRIRVALAAAAIALAFPGIGAAGDDEDEDESVTRISCVGGTAELRLRDDVEQDDDDDDDRDDSIAVELRVDLRRPIFSWRLVLLHERRIVYQGTRLATARGYSFRYRRLVPDWHGRQTVVARLTTRDGRMCRLQGTI